MATRNILSDGDKVLLKKSRIVTDFNKRLHILLDDMRETLIAANGLGLAAPQVGVLRRVALIVDTSIEYDKTDDISEDPTEEEIEEHRINQYNKQTIELINPEIIKSEGEQTGREGCLSVPGVNAIVTRPNVVSLRAQDRDGNTFELEVSELAARAVCHEVDHLDGVIFTTVADKILTDEELEEYLAENEQTKSE